MKLPKVKVQPDWRSGLSKVALNSLSLNSARLTEGSESILVNPAYDNVSDDEIRERLEGILSKCELTDKLRQIEDSNFAKFGPRSVAKPWSERRESLLDYYQVNDYDPGEFNLDRRKGRTKVPSSLETIKSKLIAASSAGLPYMMRKGIVKDDAIRNFEVQRGVYACVLFTRTQEQGKTRNVWGFAISDTIAEMRYFIPVMLYERSQFHRAVLLGPDAVDAAVTKILSTMVTGNQMFCVDFSKYDASVSPEHAYTAFKQIASLFQSEYHQDIYKLYRRFVTVPIYTPDGEWSGPHGVPSGSTFTNTIDSMVQFEISGQDRLCQVQGDDGIYLCKDNSDREDLIKRFETAGLHLNQDKSDTFEDPQCTYLQRYYHPIYKSKLGGFGGVYSIARAFLRIKYLERWTDFVKHGIEGADFFALRTIMILENCKHHPGFYETVKLAKSLDKYGLNYSRQGLKAFSRVIEPRVRAGVLNTQDITGIDAFETVRILKTL